MRLLKSAKNDRFDLAIYGLGYESRSTFAYQTYKDVTDDSVVLGYISNQNVLNYQKIKELLAVLELLKLIVLILIVSFKKKSIR